MINAVSVLLVLSSAASVVVGDNHCGGDNCARQVTGTRGGLIPVESRRADCRSFMRATVVPETTKTKTVTVTLTASHDGYYYGHDAELQAATKVPTAVPSYASACRAASNYSSACSCWGITAVTSTAGTKTRTTTVSVTTEACSYQYQV
ncbi:hypothetical protein L249_3096 [Ophiocordyceps polyrhachis-furcata BCC 54312]|uniref:Uncharacterized protein n=1 Tax=Ophiocordyceps polyrhachis-furcata BCC 54312 TaxID=1330021 RepID=A0A367LRJ1_9HYPO|nr:hypothetical protein L249_3096 [Ophiocordyceps polyrhachis-furcata BCC 54312]